MQYIFKVWWGLLMVCFADIDVSQGSVATYARCDGIFNTRLITNLLRNLPVKNFFKSVKIWQNYGYESVTPLFFGPTYRLSVKLWHGLRLADRVRCDAFVELQKIVACALPLCENMTSSTKPEVDNVLQCCQSKTDPRP